MLGIGRGGPLGAEAASASAGDGLPDPGSGRPAPGFRSGWTGSPATRAPVRARGVDRPRGHRGNRTGDVRGARPVAGQCAPGAGDGRRAGRPGAAGSRGGRRGPHDGSGARGPDRSGRGGRRHAARAPLRARRRAPDNRGSGVSRPSPPDRSRAAGPVRHRRPDRPRGAAGGGRRGHPTPDRRGAADGGTDRRRPRGRGRDGGVGAGGGHRRVGPRRRAARERTHGCGARERPRASLPHGARDPGPGDRPIGRGRDRRAAARRASHGRPAFPAATGSSRGWRTPRWSSRRASEVAR